MSNKKNIVLIGIMGCGKTTIGNILAKRLDMKIIDVDTYIEEKQGCKIADLFSQSEEYFRDIEENTIAEISEMEGYIISTGGGAVKRGSNIERLKQKGVVFFIDRPIQSIISDIDTGHRPLLKNGPEALISIFNSRYALYNDYADYVIKNDFVDNTVDMILEIWKNKL